MRRVGEPQKVGCYSRLWRRKPPSLRLWSALPRLFRGDRRGPLRMVRHLSQLWLASGLEAAVDAIEVNVDDRGDVEGQQLRDQESVDHGNSQRLTQLGTGTGTERDWQCAKKSGKGRPHDGTEPKQVGVS